MSCILAIDLGSTQFKAGLFDHELRQLAATAVDVHYCSENSWQLDWQRTMHSCRECFQHLLAVKHEQVTAVAITSQAQTFAFFNENGETDCFWSWRYEPSAVTLQEASDVFGQEFAKHCAFCEPVPGLALCTLRELHTAGKLISGAKLDFLPGALTAALCGVHCLDTNQAAMTGIFSRCSGKWHGPFLQWCGADGLILPELVSPGDICGMTTGNPDWGLPSGIPVVMCGNDQTTGAYAAGIEPGELFLSLGTAYSIYSRIPHPIRIRGGASSEYLTDGAYALKTAPLGGDALHELVMERTAGDYKKFFAGDITSDYDFIRILDGIAETVQILSPDAGKAAVGGGGARNDAMLAAISKHLGIRVRRTAATPLAGAAAMAVNSLNIN